MAEEVGEYIEELERTLTLILPLAKGYAAMHPVGSNAEYVQEAENVLTPNAVLTGAGQEATGNGGPSHRVRLKT